MKEWQYLPIVPKCVEQPSNLGGPKVADSVAVDAEHFFSLFPGDRCLVARPVAPRGRSQNAIPFSSKALFVNRTALHNFPFSGMVLANRESSRALNPPHAFKSEPPTRLARAGEKSIGWFLCIGQEDANKLQIYLLRVLAPAETPRCL